MKPLYCWVATLGLFTGVVHAQPPASASAPLDFRINPQPLQQALKEFARQSGCQVFFQSQLAKGLTAPAVVGKISPEEAMQKLLSHSGLQYRFVNACTVAIRATEGPQTSLYSSKERRGAGEDPPAIRLAESDASIPAGATGVANADGGQGSQREPLTLQEVVVTAQKKQERLLDVPETVNVVTAQTMAQSGELHMGDWATRVPGLVLASYRGVPGENEIIIRGLSDGNQGGEQPTVSIYVDDAPVTDTGNGGISADLLSYDIDHIEVLKGPQGTLYGDSSLAGVVKYVMKSPSLSSSSYEGGTGLSSIAYGNQVGYVVHGLANQVIVPDELAVGVSVAHTYTPGYVDNIGIGQRDTNHNTSDGFRGTVLWKPTGDFTVKLLALHSKTDSAGFNSVIPDASGEHFLGSRPSFSSVFAQSDAISTDVFNAVLTYDFNSYELKSSTSYSRIHWQLVSDFSYRFRPLVGVNALFHDSLPFSRVSEEASLASPQADRFHWSVGTFYTSVSSGTDIDAVGYDPATGAPSATEANLLALHQVDDQDNLAVFGSATYRLTDSVDVTGGVRLNRYRDLGGPSSASGVLEGGTTVDTPAPSRPLTQENVVTYAVTPRLHISPDSMVYGRVATGYENGGQNIGVPGVAPNFGPARTTNYEVGYKASLWHKLQVDLAAFYIDWTGIQLDEHTSTGLGFTSNGGRAASKGVESSLMYALAKNVTISNSLTYIHAALTADAPSDFGHKGEVLPDSPRWANDMNIDYTTELPGDFRGRLGGEWRYVGSQNNAFSGNKSFRHLDSYSVFNLNAGVSRGHWDGSFYVRNLQNKNVIAAWDLGANPVILQPRTIGMNVDFKY